MSLFLLFLKNFAVTAVVEGIGAACVRRDRRFVWYSLLCNLLTNPLANLLMLLGVLWLGIGAYFPLLAVLECAVTAAEAAVYRLLGGMGKARALGFSLFLNALSCLVGFLPQLFSC